MAVDSSNDALERANGDGISGILGSAYDTEVGRVVPVDVTVADADGTVLARRQRR